MYFSYYRLWKTWLNKSLEIPFWDDPSRSNMLSGSKHFWNLNGTTFTLFIDNCEGNSVGKKVS